MKRRILPILICTIFLATLCGCKSDPEPYDPAPAPDNIRVMPVEEEKPEWEYRESWDGNIAINAYNGNDVVAEIPAELDGKPVTKFGFSFEINNDVTTTLKFPACFEDIPISEIGGANITDYIVDEGNESYYSRDGLIFRTNYYGEEVLVKCPEGRTGEFEVPDSVCDIAAGAFYGCAKLTAVKIPGSVDFIGSFAFYDCTALESVTLPETLNVIDSYTFKGCTSLETLEIPETVNYIGGGAFAETPFLQKLVEQDPLVVINGILVDGSTLKGEVVIPDTVTEIASGAFTSSLWEENTGLKKVTLPEGIKAVSSEAFSDCVALEEVILPDSVADIESHAFEGCTSLKNIDLPSSLESIDWYAFSGCTSLTSVDIPDGVRSIGASAFADCENLEHVSVPDSVTYISLNDCFEGCEKINVTFKGETYTAANIEEFYAAVEANG